MLAVTGISLSSAGRISVPSAGVTLPSARLSLTNNAISLPSAGVTLLSAEISLSSDTLSLLSARVTLPSG